MRALGRLSRLALLAALPEVANASPRALAVRRSSVIAIDGVLDEESWRAAPHNSGFTQRFPVDGAAPQLATEFAVLLDDDSLYVGVWAFDPDPGKVRATLARRDAQAQADTITVEIDSDHDHRTGYGFQLSAAGVQTDFLLYDDQQQDTNWDAVWEGAARVDEHGWSAELRIPLNQLRFTGAANLTWGLQVVRTVSRTQEQSAWSPWPRTSPQIVSRFGTLEGISLTKPIRRIELLPYAEAGLDAQPSDALHSRVDHFERAGLDLKYSPGAAFTLVGSINPDFSQVESDPSVVNLTGNETYFVEKRPFFLAGVDLFNVKTGTPDESSETSFYSRRIGAPPSQPSGDIAAIDLPKAVAIDAAVKIVGKTHGWSLGALNAVTDETTAVAIDSSGARHEVVAAPLTNYSALRIKRDLREGKTSLGALFTGVERDLSDPALADVMHDRAFTAGAQVEHRWADDAWQLTVQPIASWVHGTPHAIALTQQSMVHLFQRPDATDAKLDPNATHLGGVGTNWAFGRTGNTAHWRAGIGGEIRTPGLELNDLGFQSFSDRIENYAWVQARDDNPSEHLLNWQLDSYVYTVGTLEPRTTKIGTYSTLNVQLPSYWSLNALYLYTDQRWDTMALRGGPALRMNPNESASLTVTSDTRERIWASLYVSAGRDPTSDMFTSEVDATLTLQARPNLSFFLGPVWAQRSDPLQYVGSATDASGTPHYVVARIDQALATATLRCSWTPSPRLSVDVYAQPFIATGRYSEYKDLVAPDAARYTERFHVLAGNEYAFGDGTVDVNYRGSYSVARPDFDIRELRSNVVLRWEYRPGSSLYAIWSHDGASALDDGRLFLGRDSRALLTASAHDVVMLKLSYWLGL